MVLQDSEASGVVNKQEGNHSKSVMHKIRNQTKNSFANNTISKNSQVSPTRITMPTQFVTSKVSHPLSGTLQPISSVE